MKNILVIGGAGYIGSHMCQLLAKNDYQPIVLDNLKTGHKAAVQWGPLYESSLSDSKTLKTLFDKYDIRAVMHFAAYSQVAESVKNPLLYYQNNVADTITLLKTMLENDVKNFIFSSTAAIFGNPLQIPIDETHPKNPINPYGKTKLIVETILQDLHQSAGLNAITLRYFNAAGASPDAHLGEDHQPETHLIPLVLQVALGQRDHISIFGDDYDTPDGTCVRDYIHVADLATAHLAALDQIWHEPQYAEYNLGTGKGESVKEVIEIARQITGHAIPTKISQRRHGDPATLISASAKAMQTLDWKPQFSELKTIIESAWKWHKNKPNGYSK